MALVLILGKLGDVPVLFHTTDHAEDILREGFRDGSGSYGLATVWLEGVFLSMTPANVSDGAKGDAVIAVTLPTDFDLDAHAISEVGHPVWEWIVPARLLNEVASLRLLTEEEVEEVLTSATQPRISERRLFGTEAESGPSA